ncbi:MAG: hypothetical protein JJU29_01950 [Verrucomicrobia bacterium]|nr:hypothetical protein [Verrucomicrobiota bacterium]MCH8510997.1 hypothetical protein [Kiritimatiellia bacterium]
MGYTHYWRQTKWTKDDRDGYVQALPMIRDIVHVRYPDILCQSFGLQRPPVVNALRIEFNGVDGCEDFLFANGVRRPQYCKTGHLPYDLPVCEVLLVLHAHCLNLKLSSDGLRKRGGLLVPAEDNWAEALANIRKHYSGLNLRGFALT